MRKRSPRSLVAATAGLAVTLSTLAAVSIAAPAEASVSAKISSFPYEQDWSTLTSTSTWADFPGVEGFTTGTSISTGNPPNTTDVGALTAEGTLASNIVLRAENTPNNVSNGGIHAYHSATDKTVALSATGTQTVPVLAFHLDTTGKVNIGVSYDIQDLDNSADDQPTRVALQYRVGTTGAYTNVPEAYVTDATIASNTAVVSTAVSAVLPSNADNQPDVYVRVITVDNNGGNNEHIGIDNIEITADDPGDGLKINEVYGAGGNTNAVLKHDFVELINTSSRPVVLTGKSLQYRSTGSTGLPGSNLVVSLPARIVPPGETFLIRGFGASGAVGADLPTADFESTLGDMAGANGQVFIAEGTAAVDPDGPGAGTTIVDPAVIDFVGYGTAVIREGSAAAPAASVTTSVARTNGVDTDQNSADFTAGAPTPTACTGCTDDVVPLEATNPGDKTYTVDAPIADITLSATGGTPPYSWEISGLPAGLTETSDGVIGGTPTETGTFPVTATVTDSATEPDSKPVGFTITVNPAVVPGADSVVISEVYGAGGFTASGELPASTYQNDFIELYNPTDAAISLEGWAVFYGSPGRSAGGVSNKTLLEGSIPAHGHFLVAQQGDVNGLPLPTPDVSGSLNLGAASGLIVLSDQTDNLAGVPTGNIAGTANVVDAVGYGTANTFETAAQGTTLNGVTSAQRVPVDADTDNNNADFDVAAPTPTNSEVPGTVDDLVISEIYGAGGNANSVFENDFIEIHNPTGTPIVVDGLSVQGRSATNVLAATSGNIIPLSGSIPAGGYYLVEADGSTTASTPLPTPDATGTMTIAIAGWQVWLANTTAGLDPVDGDVTAGTPDPLIIDFVGAATNATSFETAAVGQAPSATMSVTRDDSNTDTDSNLADFHTAAPDPKNSQSPVGGLQATNPGDKTYTVDEPITPITLQATGGTPGYSWEITGLPAGLTETDDGVIGGTPSAIGVSTVTATVTDSATPDAGTAIVEFTITVNPPASTVFTIAEVQGTGAASPMDGLTLTTRGVVTASYPSGSGSMAGFVIQTGGEEGEGKDYDTPGASDAIFVFSGNKPAQTIGDTVEVRGVVDERFESTQVNASAGSSTITVVGTPQPPVVPNDVVPGTDCEIPHCPTVAELNVLREEFEHEAFQPTGPYTVTDAYDGSPFDGGFGMQGEIGLAAESDIPLMIPTETIDQSDTAGIQAHRAYNEAHKLVLDDAKSLDYSSSANENTPFPWFTADHPVRTGAPVTFPVPVILKYDFGVWRILPREEVAGGDDGQDLVAIENTRLDNLAPEDVLDETGDLKIATFNMLNYFNTFGEVWAASDGTATGGPGSSYNFGNPRRCSFYTDKDGSVRITNNTCEQDAVDPLTGLNVKLPGPRGAANVTSFLRQEVKLVNAINTIDADIMSLEEVENSIKLYDPAIDTAPNSDADKNRDDALERLVSKLNEAEPGRWALVQSPRPQALPTVTEQDAIRNAFIYNPATVELVGRSQVLVNSPAMRNAREPLAQAFKPLGGGRDDAFIVIVNHFKSKGGPQAPAPPATGDNVDAGDGAGFYNGDRKRQAQALVAFANQISSDKNIEPVFLTGDFNSYSAEDPVQVIEAGGFTNLKPANGQTSYNFGGLAGSLDHVFANAAAEEMVTGEDIWEINANEAVYYEYSRYNYNAAPLYDESVFRSSDHNPEIIGIDVGELTPDPDVDTVQILATNDFHGRLVDDPGSAAAGAASMAKAVKELRAENDSTLFTAAGDLIGASTFESFIQNDEPTIDALNEAGLEVSSVGNHEFDQGYDDLVNRVMPRAEWEYLGANVEFKHTEDGHQAGDPALPETWCNTVDNGKTVGFVGAVTEDLPTLVSQDALADVVVTDIVDSVNEHADDLKGPNGCGPDGPADLVVMLVHEGAATTSFASVTDNSTFGQIVAGANENVDAIVSGHTHLAYNHKVEVPQWVTEGRDVTKRPVVSAGQYGANLNRLQFEFEGEDLVNIRQTVLQLKDYDPDPATQEIVDDAVEFAEVAGSEILGDIEDRFARAGRVGDDGQIVESRGAESTLGNLIAEVQRWKTGADIGFMNPGGLRDDIEGSNADPREVTYREAANAQPFANTLVTMELTGAQIKEVLEEQWQKDADGNVPSRPFLRLGTSEGFDATYDPSKDEGERVTGMFLDGEPLDPAETYTVSATSFLAGAGDNFWTLADGQNVQDTGQTDLQAVVDYLAEFAEHDSGDVLPVGYDQHQVGVKVNGAGPFEAGQSVTLNLSSLVMTGVLGGEIVDEQDDQVRLMDGDTELAIASVGNKGLVNDLYDERGTATLTFNVPAGVDDGTTYFTLEGVQTGTEVPIGIPTSDGLVDATVSGTNQTETYGDPITVPVTVTPSDATGTVTLMQGNTPLGQTELTSGAGSISLSGGALSVGVHHLTLVYSGDSVYGGATGTVTVTVTKRNAVLAVGAPDPASIEVDTGTSDIEVSVTTGAVEARAAAAASPTGTVTLRLGDVDGAVLDTETLDAEGAATLTAGPFASVGQKDLVVVYSGDETTEEDDSGTSVLVVAHDTTVSASGGPVTYGTDWAAAVTVAPDTAGAEVEVLDGDTSLGSGTVTAGSGSVSISGTALEPGTHTLTVKYAGDAKHAAASSTFEVVVNKATTTVTATGGTFQLGVAWTSQVTVTPSAATGEVQILDGSTVLGTATLSGGTASIQVAGSALSLGTHTLTVKYAGDARHAPASSTVQVTVINNPPTSTSVSVTCPTVTLGTDWTAQVSVTPASATGTVTVTANGTVLATGPLSGGSAALTIDGDALPAGTHTVTITYGGSSSHAGSSTTCSVTVQGPTGGDTVTSAGGMGGFFYGSGGTVNVTVTGGGPVTGTVEVHGGGILLGSGGLTGGNPGNRRAQAAVGTATIAIPPTALAVGEHTLTVKYLGDANNNPSETTLEVEVAKAISTTTLKVAPPRAVVGQDQITLTADVSATGVDPTGEVAFSANGVEIGSAPVEDGSATLTIGPGSTVTTYDLAAAYQGDGNVGTSTASGTLRVVKADVSINATVKPKRVVVDRTKSRVKIVVKAAGQVVKGEVKVRWAGKTRTVRLKDGKAVVKLGKWGSTGQKTVKVTYLGSAKANRAATEVTFTVRPRPRR